MESERAGSSGSCVRDSLHPSGPGSGEKPPQSCYLERWGERGKGESPSSMDPFEGPPWEIKTPEENAGSQ